MHTAFMQIRSSPAAALLQLHLSTMVRLLQVLLCASNWVVLKESEATFDPL